MAKKTGARTYGNPAKRRALQGDLEKLMQPTGVTDPRQLGGNIVGPGGPHDRGAVFLDMTDIVLLDGVDVSTVDAGRDGTLDGQAIYMTFAGRINKRQDRATVGFMFGPDGAAGIITELLAVADRFGVELITDMVDRLATLQREGNIDLHFVKAAIDVALEEVEQSTQGEARTES